MCACVERGVNLIHARGYEELVRLSSQVACPSFWQVAEPGVYDGDAVSAALLERPAPAGEQQEESAARRTSARVSAPRTETVAQPGLVALLPLRPGLQALVAPSACPMGKADPLHAGHGGYGRGGPTG